jgi:hypothetical protein
MIYKNKLLQTLKKFIEKLQLFFGYFFIIKFYTIDVKRNFNKYLSHNDLGSDIAILMQGQYIHKADFTYNTLLLYRKIYPNIRILLSTWEGSIQPDVKVNLEKHSIEVLINTMPDDFGIQNVNLQIKSTVEGLKLLNSKGVLFVLKTRTDQRFYSAANYLKHMISNLVHLSVDRVNDSIQHKLFVCNLNMYRFRKYIVSDMFMFGNINDMLKFWDVPFQNRLSLNSTSNPDFYLNDIAEGYLINCFFKTVEFRPSGTQFDSDIFIRNYFTLIEKDALKLFWYKNYHFIENEYLHHENTSNRFFSTLDL